MRTLGWILLIFGGLSFIGAASKGHSVFGPLFFIALGGFLLYRANNKDQKEDGPVNESKRQDIEPQVEILHNSKVSESTPNQNQFIQKETLEDIQSQLTIEQREAAMCMISFFGGFNDNLMDDTPMVLYRQAAAFFGLPSSSIAISKMMSKYPNSDILIDTILSIKQPKVKEFLILTCFDLVKLAKKPDAYDIFIGMANDLGYDRAKISKLIELYQ